MVWAHEVFQHSDLVLQFLGRRKCSNEMEARQRVHDQIATDAEPESDAVESHGAGFDADESDASDANVAIDADALETDVFVVDTIGAAVDLSADFVKSMDGDVGALPYGSYGYGTAVEAHRIVAFHIEVAAPGQS